ncbi:DNA replication and repair protein RecF [Syntrophotalea carbinolica DSM 2380]|uniref:DNA replication and repair protein RecF n=1 Tax=Syntrophotalea carbinolica (strain DSM 2380 / NBRC 103641 / GraBd1) TaxID=338963 RepID=RECF_SYNC1|nr:DNA replication and repair protein RecF [Syntrophotalea carbinolica]Q3A8M6.1 RecName: Full=DNA replication and repair protein RecF [Syntrophotalea carbinolica DSM 2380]ABA87266.1 DNA replication and repair protein RecF [Syntrophotalea carbinolica DSM 2380]
MILTRIILHNYRNIEAAELCPEENFNLLCGDNAQGKTNTLEAIYLLGHFKSFRRGRNEELIGSADRHTRVQGEFLRDGLRETVSITITGDKKNIEINGKRPRQSNEMFGRFPSVLFAPEEVSLPKGFPAGRRALLDRALCQTRPSFLDHARAYQRCLRQRNILLKSGAAAPIVLPWTEELIQTGAMVRLARRRYLDRLLPLLRDIYREICSGRESVNLVYPSESDNLSDLKEELRSNLEREQSRETKYGMTMVGPHRDDPVFMVDDRVLGLYGSQGQQRSFILAFKTAQIIDLEKETGYTPLLLLDDMTSELDRKRQDYFFRFLHQRQGQVFITCTELSPLQNAGFNRMRTFRVREGKLCDYQ